MMDYFGMEYKEPFLAHMISQTDGEVFRDIYDQFHEPRFAMYGDTALVINQDPRMLEISFISRAKVRLCLHHRYLFTVLARDYHKNSKQQPRLQGAFWIAGTTQSPNILRVENLTPHGLEVGDTLALRRVTYDTP